MNRFQFYYAESVELRNSSQKVTGFVKSRGNGVIYCCGGYHKPLRTVFLLPDFGYRDRKLEVVVCPICGALVAELVQFNVKTQKYETFRPKRKKVSAFIKKIENDKWQEIKVQYGTKERSGFVYGINREYKNGKIYQYAFNFNGERKLEKVIS